MQKPPWLILDTLPSSGVTLLYGRSGAGKSYAALDMARAVATGTPWRGISVPRGRVVLVVTEGLSGMRRRIAALLAAHPDAQLDVIDLGAGGGEGVIENMPDFLEAVAGADLVVLDSLTNALYFEYESTQSVDIAVSMLQNIARGAGCAVLAIEGKDTDTSPPGFMTLLGGATCAIECLQRKDERALKVRKHPEGLVGEILPFRLTPYTPPGWSDASVCRVDQVAYK